MTTALIPDLKILKIKITEHLPQGIVDKFGDVYQVYVYNANRHVFCCSITPTYEMNFVELQATKALSEEDHELLMEIQSSEPSVEYHNVRGVDKHPVLDESGTGWENHDACVIPYVGDEPDYDPKYFPEENTVEEMNNEAIETATEYLQGNPV